MNPNCPHCKEDSFPIAQGFKIQAADLTSWRKKLKKSIFLEVFGEVMKRNGTYTIDCGHDVPRGNEITEIVLNLKMQ